MRVTRWSAEALVIVAVILSAAACTSSRDVGQRDGPRPAPGAATSAGAGTGAPLPTSGSPAQVTCADSIDVKPQPPDGYRIVLGDVAVPTGRVLQAAESGEADPAARWFAKWGLVVRAGAAVDLQVAPGWEDRARIAWGPSAEPAATVHVSACAPAAGQPQWLAFAGGTWVAQAACVPLLVRSAGRQAEVRLAAGAPCDGADGP
ncbi:hypothetical protein ACGF5C_21970 [Micromonospora sp. NPDC047620]|uniref:hypothetical protein n=1 Tax=Micromonospora sp. NPDC047620 TaxID=3364251 RepID=UPI0037200EFB